MLSRYNALSSGVGTETTCAPQIGQRCSHCRAASCSVGRMPGATGPQTEHRYAPSPYTPIEEATSTFCTLCFALTRMSRSSAVPRVFTSTYRSIWYMLWPTLTAAPKCTTASDETTSGSNVERSRTSPCTYCTPGFAYDGHVPVRCTCGSRLSRTVTAYPSEQRRSTRCDPIYPAPPVTRIECMAIR